LAVDEGTMPWWAYGLGVGAGVRVNRLRLMVGGVLWLSEAGINAAPYGGNYERRSGQLAGCYSLVQGTVELGPCLTLTVEDVSASGSGPDVMVTQGHATWLTASIGARAGLSLGRWASLFVRPNLTFNTSRPFFAIDGVGSVYQVPLTALGVQLGCEWIF
jgi:hypothetical protein